MPRPSSAAIAHHPRTSGLAAGQPPALDIEIEYCVVAQLTQMRVMPDDVEERSGGIAT